MAIKLLRYPFKKIRDSDDYLQIDVVEYKAPGTDRQPGSLALNTSDQTYANLGDNKLQFLLSVILPIPDNISDSNSAKWGAGEVGPLSAAIADVAVGGMQEGFPGAASRTTDILKLLKESLNTGIGQAAIQAKIANIAVRVLQPNGAPDLLSRAGGIQFNQNIELLFSGVSLREPFVFTFDMAPRSEREAREIKDIIRSFKKYSAVSKGNDTGGAAGLFLKAPQVFRVRYMSGGKKHPFLNKFKICALQQITTNYTASGTYATYPDATPVNMNMTLVFQELTPIYYEDYLTQNEPEGIPKGSDDGIGVGF